MPRPGRFRLQAVLRIRRYREDQAKRRLGTMLRELSSNEERLRSAAKQAAQQMEILRKEQSPGLLNPTRVDHHRQWLARLNRVILEAQAERRDLQACVAQARAELNHATPNRKVLQALKDRQLSRQQRFLAHGEQRSTDDLSTIRFVHRAQQEAEQSC